MTDTPALDALANLAGRDPDDLRRHPAEVLPVLAAVGRDVLQTVLALADEDPAVRSRAEQRRGQLVAALTLDPDRRRPGGGGLVELLREALSREPGTPAGPAG